MSEKIIKQTFCDICKNEAEVQSIKYPVIFHTEQDEGRTVKPYVSYETIDMCQECLHKALVIQGYGAQGVNHYEIRSLDNDAHT